MRGLAEILSSIYWLALYKASEVEMYNGLADCLKGKAEEAAAGMGDKAFNLVGVQNLRAESLLGSSSDEFKKKASEASEESTAVNSINLQACFDTDQDGNSNGPKVNGPQQSDSPVGTTSSMILSEMFLSLNDIRNENKKEIGSNKKGITDANFGSKDSIGAGGSASSTKSINPGTGSSGGVTGKSSQTDGNGSGGVSPRQNVYEIN